MREISRLTSKGQITIPKAVREALSLGEGDLVAFAVADGQATMRKIAMRVEVADRDQANAQLDEWGGAADEDAYRDL
ncbi:AbrB/MazE/SpoVT family DNA-binding domain-containing protein [Reyranella sp. CPCC 100927]|uniref:AbrB/MazE/SpoVT family DNA-binding domain-containing protein n=1 Tax=Reyranella sp. CPCC 100927 TaxID=2599616 RepID=UPI0011B8312F|nr:AbrB/MazE/SpoVT family DNA-binding domain-containing protein [Reyranella sp. CPCC 100927]TWT15046.1 AbrB/MazE/SpoVT family DNA-binding domain-containing protein [Reyranella sp. CPCC 100927]